MFKLNSNYSALIEAVIIILLLVGLNTLSSALIDGEVAAVDQLIIMPLIFVGFGRLFKNRTVLYPLIISIFETVLFLLGHFGGKLDVVDEFVTQLNVGFFYGFVGWYNWINSIILSVLLRIGLNAIFLFAYASIVLIIAKQTAMRIRPLLRE